MTTTKTTIACRKMKWKAWKLLCLHVSTLCKCHTLVEKYKNIQVYADLQKDSDRMLDRTPTQKHARMLWEFLFQENEKLNELLMNIMEQAQEKVDTNECREDVYLQMCNVSKLSFEVVNDICLSPIKDGGRLRLRHVAQEGDDCLLYFLQTDTPSPTNLLDLCKFVCQPDDEPDEVKQYCADFVYQTTLRKLNKN